MPTIETRHEHARGCGYRKPGGLYLVSGPLSEPCGKLPLVLDVCPTCGAGIKPSRSWTWVKVGPLFESRKCDHPHAPGGCTGCPLGGAMPERAGLLWIGEKFYATPELFTAEAARMGISRRIPAVPNEFELGDTWVLLAHRKTLVQNHPERVPAIFSMFRPRAVEYVVHGSDTDVKLDRLEKRGITLVDVKPVPEQQALLDVTS